MKGVEGADFLHQCHSSQTKNSCNISSHALECYHYMCCVKGASQQKQPVICANMCNLILLNLIYAHIFVS